MRQIFEGDYTDEALNQILKLANQDDILTILLVHSNLHELSKANTKECKEA